MAICGSYIEPQHVYTIVNEDRNGFKSLIATTYNIKSEEKKNLDISDSIDDVSYIESSCNLSECFFEKNKIGSVAPNMVGSLSKEKNF